MSDKSKRDAQRASGTDAMASCTLTDADGNQVFVGDWVSEAEPSDSDDSEEVERRPRPRPQTKSILEHSRSLLYATAKSAGERWITIGGNSSAPKGERGGTPVMISGDGEILKGPRDLKGENLKDLGKDSDKPKKPKKPKTPERPKITLEQEKELQAIREERDRKLIAARDANDDEARDAARAQFRTKRKEIVGDTEERMQKWDNDRATEKIDDVRKRLKELEGKKPWEMTPEEFHLVPKIKRADQAKKDLKKWGKMLDDYAKATDARDWDAQEAAVKKLEDTRGLDALKKRTFNKADYGSIANLRERLMDRVEAIEKRAYDVIIDYDARREHKEELKKQAEKDASEISVENIREYAWADWMPQEAKEKVARQDNVDYWQGKKDSDEFRKQAREGRKVSNLANAAVDTFREEVIGARGPFAERTRIEKEYQQAYSDYEVAAAKSDIDAAMKIAKRTATMYEWLQSMPKDETKPIDKIVQATGGKTAKFKADIEGDVTPEITHRVDKAMEWLSSAVAPGVSPEAVKIKILKPGEGYHGGVRSYHLEGTVYLTPNAGSGVVIHEVGHAIEYANESKLGAKSEAFLAAKTFDQKVDHLGKNYEVNEVATKNGFLNAYTGKYYGSESTEILSMGLQHLYEDPVRFARESPDHFNYTTAVMRGLIE